MLEVLPVSEVLTKVLTGAGECGRIDWSFLGLTMPAWVLISLVVLGGWAMYVNFVLREPRRQLTF
jgi:disulfide bond formation protein DsbB